MQIKSIGIIWALHWEKINDDRERDRRFLTATGKTIVNEIGRKTWIK